MPVLRAHTSALVRTFSIITALLLVAIGSIVFTAPAQASGQPIVIDDFGGNVLGTRTVTNLPLANTSTTSTATFAQSDGVATMVSNGDGNSAGGTQLDYAIPTTDLTAAGNNTQFFLEFNSIQRTPEVVGETSAAISITLTDTAGHTGVYSTGVQNTGAFNIVLNFNCSGGPCFSGNIDFTKVNHVEVSILYPTNQDSGHSLTTVLNTIRTTPTGGAVPDPAVANVDTTSTSLGSLSPVTAHFAVTFPSDGSAISAAGLDASDLTVTGTAGGVSNVAVTGGPTTYDVAVGPLTSTGTAHVAVKAGAITDSWGQPSLASSGEPTVTYTKWVAPAITTSPLTGTFTVGAVANTTVTASGIPAPTFSISGGALPSGLSLASNGTISGTPAAGTGGIYTPTIKASSAAGSDSKQFTFTVNEAASFTSAASNTFAVGSAGSYTVTTRGYPKPSVSAVATPNLPASITVHDNGDGTATISGTPAAATGGSYALALTTHNGIGTDGTQAHTLVVTEKPVVTLDPSDATVHPGDSVSFTSTARGYTLPTVQWQRGTIGGSFANIAGATSTTYTFTAAAGDASTAYRAVFTNGSGTATSSPAALTVQQAPTITSAATTEFMQGTAGSFTVTTTGLPIPSITGAGVPSWVTVHDNGDGTATVSGTPPFGSAGTTVSVPLTATNGATPDATQSLSVTINLAPVIVSDPADVTVTPGSTATFTASAGGFPVPTVQWQQSTNGGGTFANIVGATSTTLSFMTVAGQNGNQYRAVFTNKISTATTTAAVLRVGTAPVITSANSVTFVTGTPKTFTITTTGSPAAGISTGTLPAWLAFTDNGDGTATLSGTAPTSAAGTSSLALTASNGFDPDAHQSLGITVNTQPVITSGAATTFTVGDAGSFTVTSTPGFPTSTDLSESGSLPDGVVFADNNDGTATLSGTPAAGAGGVYSFSVLAQVAGGSTPAVVQSFTLTVNEAPAFTSDASATFLVGATDSFTVTTAHAFPGNPSISESGALPSGVSFVDNGDGTATFAGVPAAGAGDDYAVTLTATNGTDPAAVQHFALAVDQAPTFTSAATVTDAVGIAGSFAVTTTAGFPAVTVLSESGALPGGVSFVDNADGTATISGTPALGQGGDYPLVLTATSVGSSSTPVTQGFDLVVNEAPAFTSAATDTFISGAASTFTVSTTAGYPTAATLSESGALPTGVSWVDNGDGTATLAGTSTDVGTYPLTFTVDNGLASSPTQSFTLYVATPPTFTGSGDSAFTVGVAGSATISTAPGLPDATVLTESGALPTGLTFTDNGDGTGTLAGTPAPGTDGTYALTWTASNGTPPESTRAGTITVTTAAPVALAPLLPAADGALGGVPTNTSQGQKVTVTGSGYAAGSPITIGIYSSPTFLTSVTTDATGSFTATVTIPKFTGHHTLVAAGTDGTGDPRILEAATIVSAPTTAAEVLAFTGIDSGLNDLQLALALLVAGLAIALLASIRRRRRVS
ncbi:MAG TPA: putative Ig domain-containing protein [Galbitalea sp.]